MTHPRAFVLQIHLNPVGLHQGLGMVDLTLRCDAANITGLDQFAPLLRGYGAAASAEAWNIPISDKVVSIMHARLSRH